MNSITAHLIGWDSVPTSPRRMSGQSPNLLMWLVLCFLLAGQSCAIPAAEPSAEAVEFFEKKIRPILVTHCSECHSRDSKKRQGGLLLDSRDDWMHGGDSGLVIVPGDPDKSLLILAVRQTDKDLRMPPKQKLTDTQIADLETWVKNGAVDPRKAAVGQVEELNARPKYGMSLEEGRKFWSYQPVKDPAIPKVRSL